MGMGGHAPSVPTPNAPPPPPQYPDESAASATAQEQAEAAKGGGSTIATSAQGVTQRASLGTTGLTGLNSAGKQSLIGPA
jgi:hypothetical protein